MYNKIIKYLQQYLLPENKTVKDGLIYWQEKIVQYILFSMFLLAFIAYFPSVYLSIIADLWAIALLDTVIYAGIIYLFLSPSINYHLKLYSLLAGSYLLGVILILSVGIYGAGYLWLFIIPILAGALLEGIIARMALFINTVTMVLLGVMQYNGWTLLVEIENFSLSSWLIITANFVFLNIVCTIAIVVIIRGIEITISNEKQIAESLEEKNKELVQAKNDVEAADKLKTDFLTQISHEIRTPLNTIVNFTSFIAESPDPEVNEYATSIDHATKRIIRTVEQVLNMSDILTKTYKPTRRKIDIYSGVISVILPEYQLAAKRKNVEVSFENEANNKVVFADVHALSQIINNLLDNAVKFTDNGNINIKLYNIDTTLCLEIADSGIGIDESYLKKLYQPFSQEATGYTRKFEGTGLGLSLVKNYCDINDIKLEIKSKKHQGTVVKLVFKL